MSTAAVIVVGDPARTHGRFDGCPVVDHATAARFDNATDTWAVTGPDGATLSGPVVVDTAPRTDGVVAAHGVPNYFRIPGPHTARQARYVAGLVTAMRGGGFARIEARSRVRVHRLLPTRGLARFYRAGSVGGANDLDDPDALDALYDGPATLTHAGREYPTRVRLVGHVDPIDGRYHWQGMLYTDLPGEGVNGAQVDLRVGAHTARARIADRTPWGTFSVVGVAGYPPFPLDDAGDDGGDDALDDGEVALPPRL